MAKEPTIKKRAPSAQKTAEEQPSKIKGFLQDQVYNLLLILIILVGFTFRTTGVAWDEDQHLHPDERFLTSVESALQTVDTFGEYFDTANSTLNPHNKGYGFFVYGTLPIFLTRYVAEWAGQTNYGEFTLVGRQLSALIDTAVILLVFLIGRRLYGRKVGLLAAAFSAFTVLQIQLSHFFAVDTFLNFFTLAAIYCAVLIATEPAQVKDKDGNLVPNRFNWQHFLFFGLALGMAVSSKITTGVVAVMLPLAVFVFLSRQNGEERESNLTPALGYLLLAAVISLLTFRIFQPYAFSGPGFFGMKFNPAWVDNMRSLQAQQTGDVDWPPSIQWARRPVWFSWQNLTLWGLGLPLGIAAWIGFLWVGFKTLRGDWRKHIVLWGWTAVYFLWQSSVFNPTMRYELPIYPTLAVLAAWAIWALWDAGKDAARRWLKPVAAVFGSLVLVGTFLYAFAFVQIYTRPVTRVAASYWIYQNIPGPVNLPVHVGDEVHNQPLPFPYDYAITPEQPYFSAFNAKVSGTITEVQLSHIVLPPEQRTVVMSIYSGVDLETPLVSVPQRLVFDEDSQGGVLAANFVPNVPILLEPDLTYLVRIELPAGQAPVTLHTIQLNILQEGQATSLPMLDVSTEVSEIQDFTTTFSVSAPSTVAELNALLGASPTDQSTQQILALVISDVPDMVNVLATAKIVVNLQDGQSRDDRFILDRPVVLEKDKQYYYQIRLESTGGSLSLLGSAVLIESPWDDGLPLRVNGYDGYGGIYQPDFALDMYWNGSHEKRERMLEVINGAEYITISSSRQWGSTPRIPERYPLNIVYYRNLLGCPDELTIEYCYNVAQPGMFEGTLGFDLVAVFDSSPNLGSLVINDQFAEEAFTVYDHPKVFIFEKRADYDPAAVAALFNAVDVNQVQHITPKQASGRVEETPQLLLPEARWEAQQTQSTWSELFNIDSIVNAWQPLTVLIWYVFVFIIGLAVYPLARQIFTGLPDKGYPLARTLGMLIFSYLAWLAGSVGLSYSRLVIWGIFALLLLGGGWLGYKHREELKQEWAENKSYFLSVEAIFFAFFLVMLIVRLGNPDLWHPAKGGEKPMDFSYLNAVLKSNAFPPYDPWFAGGYINYYYYGFVFVGTLVKMLGVVPAVAYNLILPTLLGMLTMGAFSVAWNLFRKFKDAAQTIRVSPWLVGISSAMGIAMFGNLGSLRMIWVGLQQLGAMGMYSVESPFFDKLLWTFKGLGMHLGGTGFTFYPSDWYWTPSRAIYAPNDVAPITEFPWFTFVYADLHAHMIALPISLLAIGWILSMLFSDGWRGFSKGQVAASLLVGGLTVGALRPTNTWDLPTYLALGAVVMIYALWRNPDLGKGWLSDRFSPAAARWLSVGGALAAFAGLSFLLFAPFGQWYAQGYSEIRIWDGTQTPMGDYFIHWGVFLFIILFWMAWETRQWLAQTPVSSLRKLEPYRGLILAVIGLVVIWLVIFHVVLDIRVHWFALPAAIWAAVLLFRPNLPDDKRFLLFVVGTCLFLTLLVEVIVLAGDIGRMNTVFKFYLQVWVMFGMTAAVAFGWTLAEMRAWTRRWQIIWQTGVAMMVAAALLFPIMGTASKINDRMAKDALHSLDGMAYMGNAEYADEGGLIDLSQDYEAIQWMQQNVEGTPVIVEAHTPEYRWGTRFTIYTGLPGVLGWRWHQTQQRVSGPNNLIPERADAIANFYLTTNREETERFLDTYNVKYIVVGQLERNYYPGGGLLKFVEWSGDLWTPVYQKDDTVIYKVMEP